MLDFLSKVQLFTLDAEGCRRGLGHAVESSREVGYGKEGKVEQAESGESKRSMLSGGVRGSDAAVDAVELEVKEAPCSGIACWFSRARLSTVDCSNGHCERFLGDWTFMFCESL